MSTVGTALRAVVTPKRVAVAAGAGVATAGVAYATRDDRELLWMPRSFYAGLGAGIAGAFLIKAGLHAIPTEGLVKRIPAWVGIGEHATTGRHVAHHVGLGSLRFTASLVVGTIPGLLLLNATRDGKELLGQGHSFWSGAVWGLAAVAGVKALSGNILKHGPLAAGWVLGDFAAIGLDSAINRGHNSGH